MFFRIYGSTFKESTRETRLKDNVAPRPRSFLDPVEGCFGLMNFCQTCQLKPDKDTLAAEAEGELAAGKQELLLNKNLRLQNNLESPRTSLATNSCASWGPKP